MKRPPPCQSLEFLGALFHMEAKQWPAHLQSVLPGCPWPPCSTGLRLRWLDAQKWCPVWASGVVPGASVPRAFTSLVLCVASEQRRVSSVRVSPLHPTPSPKVTGILVPWYQMCPGKLSLSSPVTIRLSETLLFLLLFSLLQVLWSRRLTCISMPGPNMGTCLWMFVPEGLPGLVKNRRWN